MVLSGSAERVVFVHDRPGDEARLTGGVIARLRAARSAVVVVFTGAPADFAVTGDADVHAAAAVLGAQDVRFLGDAPASAVRATLRSILAEARATAVVLGELQEPTRGAASQAAEDEGVALFESRSVAAAPGERLIAIDVTDQVAVKCQALAAYPSRFTVQEGALLMPDGRSAGVDGSETYIQLAAAPGVTGAHEPARAARLGLAAIALVAGVLFAVLGTLAHQVTLEIGSLSLPIGVLVAIVAASALIVGLRLLLGDRLVAGMGAAGLLVTTFLLSLRGAGGSVLVPESLAGTLWTLVPAFVAALVLAWPKISLPSRAR
ncbi:MAG: hypothetical protein R6W83_07115 [Cryobacterium sp.]